VAAVLGDLIQVLDNQVYLEQQVLNVYYYRVTSITGLGADYLSALNDIWEATVLDPILAIQLSSLVHVSRDWRNLSNGIDLFTAVEDIVGEVAFSTAIQTPSYVSAGFMLRRETLETRNGYKRFAGLPDDAIAGNNWTGTGADIEAIETALAADLIGGLITLAEPVIVKRPITPPVTTYVYSSIGSATFRGLGTQNTRKQGRGV